MDDNEYMRAALALARRGLGRTAPNPSVGCVLVKKNVVIARGWTGDGGRPHAEAIALQRAGVDAKGATAYVTLEPCSHHGQTGPCAEALIKADVKRVVYGAFDPDPRVSGRGMAMLKDAGIETVLLKNGADEINQGFFLRVTQGRPWVTLKIATTGDGKIALREGQREWITGELARRHVHFERSKYDAILVGIGTVLVDDPLLTTRLKGVTHKAPRIILDSKLKIPLELQLVRTSNETPLWIFHESDPEQKAASLEKHGARLFQGTDIKTVLAKLAEEGITRLLVEGGAEVLKSFAEAGVCDEFLLYKAPGKAWPDGKPSGFEEISRKIGLKLAETRVLGEDLLEIYGR